MGADTKGEGPGSPMPERPLDGLLTEALERSARHGLPPISAEVCRLLEILAGERGTKRILEMGRGLGVSTICLARGAEQAEVVSVDASGRYVDDATELLERAALEPRVTLSTREPLAAIRELEGRFDLIHLRIEAPEVIRVADRLLPSLEVGGLLIVQGLSPADEARRARSSAVAAYLLMHPQLDAQDLRLGEGVVLARKKAPLVTELGGPF